MPLLGASGPCRLSWLLPLFAGLPGGVPSADLERQRSVGRCACDLTGAQCDVHCCCDPDCGQDGLAELRQGFDCLPDGLEERTARHCYSKSWLHAVNPRTDLAVLEDDLRGLLCVVVDNNPVKGVYYTNQAQVPTTRIDSLVQERLSSSWNTAVGGQAQSSPQARGYIAGDVLMIHLALSSSTGNILPVSGPSSFRQPGVVEATAPLPLRVPDVFGACAADPGQPARFMADVPETSCWLEPVDLADACTRQLNPRTQVAWMLRESRMSGQSRCSSGRCVQPNLTASCPVRTTDVDGNVRDTPCQRGQPAQFQDPVFLRTSDTCLCRNALREVHYTFHYAPVQVAGGSSVVSITDVEVRMTLQDVESRGCQPTRVYQATSARFLRDGGSGVAYARSGNPGYRVGAPLLAARCQSDGVDALTEKCVAFEEASAATRTATVPGIMPDGACARVSGPAGRPAEINFGEDSIFGCTLELTRGELANLCRQGQDVAHSGFVDLLQILRFGRSGSHWTHIAAFGDVPPGSQVADNWVEVKVVQSAEALEFSDKDVNAANLASDSSCRGAVVGVDLEIVYSPFGKVGHPQNRVVAARASHRRGVLTYRRLDARQKQSFPFTFTVTFLRLDDTGQTEVEVPPRPRLPLALPHDLFYPFDLGGGAPEQALPSLVPLLLSVVGLYMSAA